MNEALVGTAGPTVIAIIVLTLLLWLLRKWLGAYLVKFAGHGFDVSLEKHKDELRRSTELEIAAFRSSLALDVEVARLRLKPYSENQFFSYNELWASICDLRESMERLWSDVTEPSLRQFAVRLTKTRRNLERSALLVKPRHYRELSEILDAFAEYRVGKERLLDIYSSSDSRGPSRRSAVEQLVEDNRETRERLIEYLPRMKESLRKQLATGAWPVAD